MLISDTIIHTCCYAMVWVTAWLSKIFKAEQLAYDDGKLTSNPKYLLAAHFTGICCLGIIPSILLSRPVFPLLLSQNMPSGYVLFSFAAIFLLTINIIYRQAKNIRSRITGAGAFTVLLTPAFFGMYFITRIIFLFCYELWFRGLLLFDTINQLGILSAVVINVLAYVLLHIFKSKKEILACIPFGIATCSLSILFNAVWPAIVLHISVSAVYELQIYQTWSAITLNKKL